MSITVIKEIVGLVGTIGASMVIGNVIKATTPKAASVLVKAGIFVGKIVIIGIAEREVFKYTNSFVNEVKKSYDKSFGGKQEDKKETEIFTSYYDYFKAERKNPTYEHAKEKEDKNEKI